MTRFVTAQVRELARQERGRLTGAGISAQKVNWMETRLIWRNQRIKYQRQLLHSKEEGLTEKVFIRTHPSQPLWGKISVTNSSKKKVAGMGFQLKFNNYTNTQFLFLYDARVLSTHRFGGIMTQMLAEASFVARKVGAKEVVLLVRKNNKPAYDLYKKFGFRDLPVARTPVLSQRTEKAMRMVIQQKKTDKNPFLK